MGQISEHHKTLTDGAGKCSVPMWMGGLPAGFCDVPAYGVPLPYKTWRNAATGELFREDGGYTGYVPALACVAHGGPPRPAGLDGHIGDPCRFCGTPHDDVPIGPCAARTTLQGIYRLSSPAGKEPFDGA